MKRRVILLLLLLAGGAIINIAVAWAICLLERQLVYNSDEASAPLSDGSVLRVLRYDSTFTTVCTIVRGYSESQPTALMNFDGDPFRLAPSWARASVDAPTLQFTSAREQYTWISDQLTVVGVGWPFRAGRYPASHSVYAGPTYLLVYQSSRPATGPRFSGGSYYGLMRFQRALPTRVIWPGFVLNSMLFAAVLWLLVLVNPRLRQRQRIKRGLCPRCAYPVGASDVCTECGAGLRAMR